MKVCWGQTECVFVRVSQLAATKSEILELLSQLELVHLACCCVRNLFNKSNIIRNPPICNFALYMHSKIYLKCSMTTYKLEPQGAMLC